MEDVSTYITAYLVSRESSEKYEIPIRHKRSPLVRKEEIGPFKTTPKEKDRI